jgi:nucleotide-binding universal stress UspA family protein
MRRCVESDAGSVHREEEHMLPVRRIVHPTDFTPASDHAFRIAGSLARDYGARLLVLHVAPPETVYSGLIGGPAPKTYRDDVDSQLRSLTLPELGILPEHELREGDAATEILRVASADGGDLIVMATHGRSGMERLVMGSVAEAVMRHAACPVLVVQAPLSRTAENDAQPQDCVCTS